MLSQTKEVYRMDHRALWDVASPRDAVRAYLHRITEFVTGLAVRDLTCRPTKVGGTWFGIGGIEAVLTTLLDNPLYAVSVGLAYGPRCVILATFRCMEGWKPGADRKWTPAELYELVEAEAAQSAKSWLEFRFLDSLMARLHVVGTETPAGPEA
jgi:hypothetical protein